MEQRGGTRAVVGERSVCVLCVVGDGGLQLQADERDALAKGESVRSGAHQSLLGALHLRERLRDWALRGRRKSSAVSTQEPQRGGSSRLRLHAH